MAPPPLYVDGWEWIPCSQQRRTIFIKWEGDDFIIHGLFVDDLQTASTSQTLMDKFLEEYSREFEITGGEVMSTFLGLQVDQV